MQNLCRVAKAHFRRGSEEVQTLGRNFFNAMDANRDTFVTESEFKAFLRQEANCQHMATTALFRLLDMNNRNALGFWEVMTLYYIIKSRRPFCQKCKEFITSTYFTCVECFESPNGRYCLCLRCFESPEWSHSHQGRRSNFLDNYTFLETKRISAMSQRVQSHSVSSLQRSRTSTNSVQTALVPYDSVSTIGQRSDYHSTLGQHSRMPSARISYSGAVVPYNTGASTTLGPRASPSNALARQDRRGTPLGLAYGIFEAAVASSIGTFVGGLCTIL